MIWELLKNGARVLFWRLPLPERPLTASDGVLSASAYLLASLLLSFLANGAPGHIEWLALPDIVFPLMILGFSAWVLSVVNQNSAILMPVFLDMVNARTLILAVECVVRLIFKGKPGADESIALLEQGFELWWILAGLVRFGRYANHRVLPTLLGWATFFVPWFYLLMAYPSTDLWQAEGLDMDPKQVIEAMTEDVFTSEPALLDEALNELQAERPGIDDLYFLGVAGNGYRPLYRREVEEAQTVMNREFDTLGRGLILANDSGREIHYPFATHSNLESALNQLAEVMDVDDDILFLFVSSEGLSNQHLRLAQPGLLMPDLKPSELKDALDSAKITWRIIVISGCYSGGFIDALHDSHTLIITSTDASSEGLGCRVTDRSTWFVKTFFDEAMGKTKSIPEAFRIASQKLQDRQKASGQVGGLPQIDIGADMVLKLDALEKRLSRPGGVDSGVRAEGFSVKRGYPG